MQDIRRYYPNGDAPVKALDDVCLTIWPGEFVAIIGQSGSGKSTLMNLIGCLDKPDSGEYQIFGKDVAEFDHDQLATLRRQTFGFVFQRYNLLNGVTAVENVEMPALYAGIGKNARRIRAEKLLARLGLVQRNGHFPMQLSGGQQQRVAIARALINDPPVILADEPTGALDSKSGEEVMALLADLHRDGRTILLITHDEKVAAHAERTIVLRDGIITSDSGENIRDPIVQVRENLQYSVKTGAELFEAAKMALRSLRTNWFRTVLTLLGIVIGVASVVTMLAVGQGSQEKVLTQMRAMGTNILSIRPGTPGMRGRTEITSLIPTDVDAILELKNVEWASPERSSRLTLRQQNMDYATNVQGVLPSMTKVRDWTIADGDFFNERDVNRYASVVVLGQTVRQILFPDVNDPLGHHIMIGNIPFEVIGVLSAKGSDAQGNDRDDTVFIPLTTGLSRLFGQNYLGGIAVKVYDVNQIDSTLQAIQELLITRHRTEDFRIRNMASVLATTEETQSAFTMMLGIVAAISLLVGGIGVMNIMLVSVTERTREIGVRIATGARRRDILLQFNTEAAIVCILGGLAGVILGFAAGNVMRYFDMAVIFSPFPAILAFSCAFGTGILFGYLPARKAAALDPVMALAAE
jgi:macrolide transport system ATP-binding/permease protein